MKPLTLTLKEAYQILRYERSIYATQLKIHTITAAVFFILCVIYPHPIIILSTFLQCALIANTNLFRKVSRTEKLRMYYKASAHGFNEVVGIVQRILDKHKEKSKEKDKQRTPTSTIPQEWKKGMLAKPKNSNIAHYISSVDFEENLIGYYANEYNYDAGYLTWVRAENCDFLSEDEVRKGTTTINKQQ